MHTSICLIVAKLLAFLACISTRGRKLWASSQRHNQSELGAGLMTGLKPVMIFKLSGIKTRVPQTQNTIHYRLIHWWNMVTPMPCLSVVPWVACHDTWFSSWDFSLRSMRTVWLVMYISRFNYAYTTTKIILLEPPTNSVYTWATLWNACKTPALSTKFQHPKKNFKRET